MQKQQNSQRDHITLRNAVISCIMENPVGRDKLLEILSSYDNCGAENDIFYALLLKMELQQKSLEMLDTKHREFYKTLRNEIQSTLGEEMQKMNELLSTQQVIFRSQFRRLLALHRERFLLRVLIYAAAIIVCTFVGIGAFGIYKLFV